MRLPGGHREEVFYARAYDAGTEVNDEVAGSIVPPCFGIGPVTGLIGGEVHKVADDASDGARAPTRGTRRRPPKAPPRFRYAPSD